LDCPSIGKSSHHGLWQFRHLLLPLLLLSWRLLLCWELLVLLMPLAMLLRCLRKHCMLLHLRLLLL
jgi:hypothetical protein